MCICIYIHTHTHTHIIWGFHDGWAVKNPHAIRELQEMRVRSLGGEDPLEEGMATHSSILAWRIPWTEEHGGLQSIWLQRVGHDWNDSTFGEGPLPGLSMAALYRELAWPCSCVCRIAEGALISSYKVTTLTTSSKPHLMKPDAPPPNTIALQVRVSTYKLRGMQTFNPPCAWICLRTCWKQQHLPPGTLRIKLPSTQWGVLRGRVSPGTS